MGLVGRGGVQYGLPKWYDSVFCGGSHGVGLCSSVFTPPNYYYPVRKLPLRISYNALNV